MTMSVCLGISMSVSVSAVLLCVCVSMSVYVAVSAVLVPVCLSVSADLYDYECVPWYIHVCVC